MTARAYLRYSPATFHDKVVVDGYPPGAFAAFSAVLCLAEEQPERGRFRSEKLLRLMLDEPEDGVRLGWGKWVPYLVEHGDLVRLDRGVMYVVGWDEWQEGDVTVAERMRRVRSKKSHGDDRNADPATDTAPTVTEPAASNAGDRTSRARATTRAPSAAAEAEAHSGGISGGGGSVEARNGESAEPYRTAEELTGNFPIQRFEVNAIKSLDALSDRRGIAAVVTAMREVAPSIPTQPPSPWQLVSAAVKHLEPFSGTGKAPPSAKGQTQSVDEIREAIRARNA